MKDIEVNSDETGERAIVLIDGLRVTARNNIAIRDGVITVDGKVQGIIYGDAVVLVKSGDAEVSAAVKTGKSKK